MSQLQAQSNFVHYAHPGIGTAGSTITAAPNGNVLLGGSYGLDPRIALLSPAGAVIWDRYFPTAGQMRGVIDQIMVTSDGFIIGIGNKEAPAPLHRSDGFAFKMDMNGNLIWKVTENHAQSVYFTKIMELSSTEYAIYCAYEDLSSYQQDIAVVKILASNGSLVSHSGRIGLGIDHLDDAEDAVLGPNGLIYLTGRSYFDGGGSGNMRPFVVCMNQSLQIQWQNYYDANTSAIQRLYGIGIVSDGASVVCLVVGDRLGASTNFTTGLFKINLQGNQLWTRWYDLPGSTQELSYSVSKVPQGYCIYGQTSYGSLFIIQTDDDGHLQWTTDLSNPPNSLGITSYTTGLSTAGNTVWYTGRETQGANQTAVVGSLRLGQTMTCPTYGLPSATEQSGIAFQSIAPIQTTIELLPLVPTAQMQSLAPQPACSAPSGFLGPDTTFCSGLLTLNAQVPGATQYYWSSGDTTQAITVTVPGTYIVTVSINCCQATDTIEVHWGSGANTVSLGPDQALCNGNSLSLDLSGPGLSFAWSTGDTTGQLTISNPGTYSVTVTSTDGCEISDTLIVSTMTLTTDLGPDTLPCISTGQTLGYVQPGATYAWNTGDTSSTITPTGPGWYSVTVSIGPGCQSSDSVLLLNMQFLNLGADTAICNSDTLILQVSGNWVDYQWSTGDTNASVTLQQAGTYSLIVTDGNGCTYSDTLQLGILPTISINLGPDVERCGEDGVWLYSPVTADSLLWSTGAATDSIWADTTGSYSLMVATDCGIATDAVHVTLIREPKLQVPNVFSPNGDGINDVLLFTGPVWEGYDLQLYDRWGHLYYSSRDIQSSWDGYIGGNPAPEGVYYFTLQVLECNRKLKRLSGPVSLVR